MSLRQRVEVAVVRLLLQRATAARFTAYAIDDGEEQPTNTPDHDSVMREVFNRDDCLILFKKGRQRYWVKVVLGNDGDDCLSDWGTDNGPFDALMETVQLIATRGMFTLSGCPGDSPAWDMGPRNNGPCIHCGTRHNR
jgi:hypothetical protein